jgi:hypothetical protein
VGCAVQDCSHKRLSQRGTIIVCHYSPRGNVRGTERQNVGLGSSLQAPPPPPPPPMPTSDSLYNGQSLFSPACLVSSDQGTTFCVQVRLGFLGLPCVVYTPACLYEYPGLANGLSCLMSSFNDASYSIQSAVTCVIEIRYDPGRAGKVGRCDVGMLRQRCACCQDDCSL